MNVICRVFGHHFVPRYDKSAPNIPAGLKRSDAECLELMRAITYRCDVCQRCGEVAHLKREQP